MKFSCYSIHRLHVRLTYSLAVLFGVFLTSVAAAEPLTSGLKVGVIPQQSAKKIRHSWTPLIEHIESVSGYPVALETAPDIPTFEKRLFSGHYDLIYVNPKLYVEANKRVGYRAIAKEKNKKLTGIIIVAKDSKIKSLSELEGKEIAFPKSAFAASVIPRLNLEKQNIQYVPKFMATHDQGYAMVANGNYVAAGGVLRTFEKVTERVKSKLRILWKSSGMAPHSFAVHPSMDKIVSERIQEALLSFASSETAATKKANKLGFNALIKADNHDWDDIRKLID